MGGLTGAVDWWEESQLRVLVLTSLVIQSFLFFFPKFRRRAIPGWFRFILWLAYHAGDAVAIYGLATLFNRHKDEGDGVGGSSSSNTLLEVVWAPFFLIHLGGHDGVTAYNIEDNELWTRHMLTTVSQVTVAVYVFCKSWPPGGDKKLLAAAILLFIVGVVKCFMKAWAFKMASINSLASSGVAETAKQINDGNMFNTKLEEYVKTARVIVGQQQPAEEDEEPAGPHWMLRLLPGSRRLRGERQEAWELRQQEKIRLYKERGEASNKLFVDLSSSYTHRISIFDKFWGLSEEGRAAGAPAAPVSSKKKKGRAAYDSVQGGLATAFFLLYTKVKTARSIRYGSGHWEEDICECIQGLRMVLPWVSIALFHWSHREAYNDIDVKVTYAILCCTAVLETYSSIILMTEALDTDGPEVWPETVAQYSLAGYFVRNKKHSIKMRIVSFVGCKDFLDQHWCMEPCFSSSRIAHLVLRYLKDGWKQEIEDAASYRSFNNHSSRWGLNMNRSFDECVLLWHLATDFCFFSTSFPDHRCAYVGCTQESVQCKALRCRQMSNYMVYLLFVNPEMLLPVSRRNLFKTAYDELKDILRDWEWNPVRWSRCMPCGVKLIKEETTAMERLITVMQDKTGKRASQEEPSNEAIVRDTVITFTQQKSERSPQEESSMEGSNRDENFIYQAWALAQRLLEMDEMERWKEIQDVWVQMLCFSASRCRGYLHAKALGKGGEFLSHVWLLLFYMGMETFSERLQRDLFPSCQGNNDTTSPPTSKVCTTSTASSSSTVHTRASISAGTTASTSEI